MKTKTKKQFTVWLAVVIVLSISMWLMWVTM